MADLSLNKFARRILRLERDFKTFQVTPRLGNSSIDNGGAIFVNDPVTGSPQLIIGNQGDGTNMVQQVGGATPPQPSVALVEPGISFVYVTWDGRYAGDSYDPLTNMTTLISAPLDFARVEVHCSPLADFEPDPDITLKATIETARGATVAVGVPYDQPSYFRLVVRSLSGKASPPSTQVAGQSRKIESPDLDNFIVTGDNIADFALVVTKFKTLQHLIY